MKVPVLGGPHDGARTPIPDDMGKGQMFLIDDVQYFLHVTKEDVTKLIYYTSSLET